MDEEEWSEIRGFPNYVISSFGRIGNWTTGTELKPRPSGWGYLQVMLSINGKQFTKSIHLLVAEYFVPGMDEGLEPNHKDGNKQNNYAYNLEWVTKGMNNQHALDTGLRKPRGTSVVASTGERFSSVKECAEYFGCHSTTISSVLNGRLKSWKGLTFSYGD